MASNMELVLSRGCRHNDWVVVPTTKIECCRSCGFSVVMCKKRLQFYLHSSLPPEHHIQRSAEPTSGLPPLKGFTYPSLDLAHGRGVRLLILKAGGHDDALRCELEAANLQCGPVFEAVSYTWASSDGDDSLCRSIQCDNADQHIGITRSCEAALRNLRYPDKDRVLWVDAICIDQSNFLERNHQVRNMIAVFRTAQRVLVYLGEGSHNVRRLFEYATDDRGGDLPSVLDFIALLRRRWFYRVWVLQEVAVAKSVVVVYGDRRMSWEDMMKHCALFSELVKTRRIPFAYPPLLSYGIRNASQNKTGYVQENLDLLEALQISRNCSCKDPRDKVYALTGLLRNIPIHIDYSPSTTAGFVFSQVAAWHILITKSLEILSYVSGASGLQMPSWAPDWTQRNTTPLPPSLNQLTSPSSVSLIDRNTNQELAPTLPLNFPLQCSLLVSGSRLGSVWTLPHIFGQPSDGEVDASPETYQLPRGQWQDTKLVCGQVEEFWDLIQRSYNDGNGYHGSWESRLKPRQVPEVPPAFGGPCTTCFDLVDKVRVSALIPCTCGTRVRGQAHFISGDLWDFTTAIRANSKGRRMFATERSLGYGPACLRDGDEVWQVRGARNPLILRRDRDHCTLVGECHLHAATRETDKCPICLFRRMRPFAKDKEDFRESTKKRLEQFWEPVLIW